MITPLRVSVGRISTGTPIRMEKQALVTLTMLIASRVDRSVPDKCSLQQQVKASADADVTVMSLTMPKVVLMRDAVVVGLEITTHWLRTGPPLTLANTCPRPWCSSNREACSCWTNLARRITSNYFHSNQITKLKLIKVTIRTRCRPSTTNS